MNQIEKLKAAPMEHQGHRVITLGQMDEAHGRPEGTAKKAWQRHRARLVEGSDYFQLPGESRSPGGRMEPCILLAESGYLLLVKTFRDDLAWQVQRELVAGYFRSREGALAGADARIDRALALAQDANRTVHALTGLVSALLKDHRRRNAEAGRVLAGFRPRTRRAPRRAPAQLALLLGKKKPGAA